MEKIKAALHIHDKTDVPNDGAIGNMQNPSSSDDNGPTATELWGSGNAESVHHHNRKGDAVASTASGQQRLGMAEPKPRMAAEDTAVDLNNPAIQVQNDDAFTRAQRAQQKAPALSQATDRTAVEDKGVGPVVSASSIPEEKIGSSSAEKWAQIDPLNQPEPSVETGPGTHFRRPDTATTSTTATTATASTGGIAAADQEGHTAYYDMATGREPHSPRGTGTGR